MMSYCHSFGNSYQLLSSIVSAADERFTKYAIRVKKNVYLNGDVLNGNVAGFINSSIGREYIGNVF